MKREFRYWCTRCKKEMTTDQSGYVKCPICGKGDMVRDYGDYDGPLYTYGGFNWNKN